MMSVTLLVALKIDSSFFPQMWSPVTPKNDGSEKTPTARSKHSVTLHGDHLYLIAGRNGNIPLKDIWRYSLSKSHCLSPLNAVVHELIMLAYQPH